MAESGSGFTARQTCLNFEVELDTQVTSLLDSVNLSGTVLSVVTLATTALGALHSHESDSDVSAAVVTSAIAIANDMSRVNIPVPLLLNGPRICMSPL